ncbi:MAG TPA: hypothetical protein VGF70_10140 [Solirubrobacteraceae bacterium]|jgi:ElaB/YqjD/DUF883 family membrane-anchored ribosome-binding protein
MTDTSPISAQEAAVAATAQTVGDRPEVIVGAAFAAGLSLALILKRIAR